MGNYKCNKCHKTFKHKNDYKKHKNRKTLCISDSENRQKFGCPKCNHMFATRGNLNRHTNISCKYRIKDKKFPSFNEINQEDVINYLSNNSDYVEPVDFTDDENQSFKNLKDFEGTEGVSCSESVETEKKSKYTCNYCKKIFARSDALNVHLNSRCKVKNSIEKEKERIYQKLLDELDEKENLIKNLQERETNGGKEQQVTNYNNTSTTNNNISTSNTSNNNIVGNTINIQLLAYGSEDLSHITDKNYKYFINKGFKSVPELVKYIHFNKGKPENHNIYISNLRDNLVMVYNGNRWELQDRRYAITDLYNTKRDLLTEKYEELAKELPNSAVRKFDRFVNDEQDKDVSDSIKNELKLILYNNKNIPEETKQKIELLKLG